MISTSAANRKKIANTYGVQQVESRKNLKTANPGKRTKYSVREYGYKV